MAQIKLTDEEIQKLIECIKEGVEVPEDLLPKLSPSFFERLRAAGKFDYKELDKYKIPVLEYAGKRSESVILAQAVITGGAAPLQVVRSFENSTENDWRNMIVQGDNLQFLKTCYMNQDPLIKNKVRGKIKLIYIDPPFATRKEFASSEGEQSYSDKIDKAEFLEGLRERLIYMRELLSEDGSIFVHLDHRSNHYVKIIIDEVFGKEKFINELIWIYARMASKGQKKFNNTHQTLFWYKRSSDYTFNVDDVRTEYAEGSKARAGYVKKGVGSGFFKEETMCELNPAGKFPDDWFSIPFERNNVYPTQKPEPLLEKIILAASNKGDLIFDCFAGSGTTALVAEKLGRRWIMCDFGKHAIYTMQKHILNIADSNKLNRNGEKKKKYGEKPTPFDVISAGAYDFSKIMNLRENKDVYVSFVLGLFGIIRENTDFSKKYKLPNIHAEKDGDPVEVYPIWEDEYLKDIRIDEEYLQGIIDATGGKFNGNYYIITPETCTIVGDITMKNSQKEDINFHMLKFPYKVLEDVSRQFQIEEQPSSIADINKLISSTGFYFNEEVSIKVKKVLDGIKIENFSTMILSSNKELFKGLDGLSMILFDNNYNGQVFNMDQAIYAKDITEDGVVKDSGLSDQTAIIAIDKHGNESKVIRV